MFADHNTRSGIVGSNHFLKRTILNLKVSYTFLSKVLSHLTWENQTLQNVASGQGLHGLPFIQQFSDTSTASVVNLL